MRTVPLFALLLFSCRLLSAAEEPELLFHARFDGSAAAVTPRGEVRPLEQRNLAFGPGIGGNGQALRSTKAAGTLLKYALKDHLLPASGTVSLWFRPEWKGTGANGKDRAAWRTLISTDVPRERLGSGAIQFWCWGDVIRGDRGDKNDSFRTGPPLRDGEWRHLAFTWGNRTSRVYVDGIPQPLSGDNAPLRIIPEEKAGHSPELEHLFVGGLNGIDQADGLIDELRIWSAPLTPDRIRAEAAEFRPMRTTVLSGCFFAGTPEQELRFRAENRGEKTETLRWKLVAPDGTLPASGEESLPGGQSVEIRRPFRLSLPGDCRLEWSDPAGNLTTHTIRSLAAENPMVSTADSLRLTPVDEVRPSAGLPADRFTAIGKCERKELGGVEYLEAGNERCDRFAVRFRLPDPDALYLFEWEYPDDRKRTMDVTAQPSRIKQGNFQLQTGILAGDLYPNSGNMQTQRAVYFADDRDVTLIFMTARAGEPAAVSRIRVSRIDGGLPDARIRAAAPENGMTRTVGVYFEDPALNYLFGVPAETVPGAEAMLNRLTAYMKYSGQNLLAYPMVWYQGYIGEAYNPRNHAPGFFDLLLTRFDAEKLDFLGTVNWNTLPGFPFESVTKQAVKNGTLHASAATILRNGKPHIGGWHDTPPNFNILHPEVQSQVSDYVDRMLETGAPHPSFRGVVLHITRHSILSFGDIDAGYNDYAVERFEKATGIRVPVDRNAPERGRLYADWLLANAREKWIQWRCAEIAAFYRTLAEKIAAKRPDLKLVVNCMIPPSKVMHRRDFRDPGFVAGLNQEAGIDPELLKDIPNLILDQSAFPADYRWEEGKEHRNLENYAHLREIESLPGYYRLLDNAASPWLHIHDRYWESAVGSRQKSHWSDKPNPLAAPWLTEHGWRVSTLIPTGIHAMRHHILPFRYGDLLGITKGGFLIGTFGMEPELAAFSRAFRALPAKKFRDVPFDSETVRVRMLKDEGRTWFYAVNTSDVPEKVAISVPGGQIRDAADDGDAVETENGRFVLTLAPYQFRSFRADGERTVGAEAVK